MIRPAAVPGLRAFPLRPSDRGDAAAALSTAAQARRTLAGAVPGGGFWTMPHGRSCILVCWRQNLARATALRLQAAPVGIKLAACNPEPRPPADLLGNLVDLPATTPAGLRAKAAAILAAEDAATFCDGRDDAWQLAASVLHDAANLPDPGTPLRHAPRG